MKFYLMTKDDASDHDKAPIIGLTKQIVTKNLYQTSFGDITPKTNVIHFPRENEPVENAPMENEPLENELLHHDLQGFVVNVLH